MKKPAKEAEERIFQVDCQGDTLIIVPQVDLRELEYRRIELGATEIFELMKGSVIKNAVLDFHKTTYFCSSALAFFVRLWNRVRICNGRMAFCNVSDNEHEVLRTTKLDKLWPICASRPDALQAIN